MFAIHEDMTIYATRGDAVYFTAEKKVGDAKYKFQPEDVVRIKIFEKKNPEKVVLMKDFLVEAECTGVPIFLDRFETKIGEIIAKPVDYWYEVELNPDTVPDTFIGYNENGPAVFRLFPEGKDVVEGDIPDPEENAAVTRMVVTFVNEFLGLNAETIVKEVIEKESMITNEVLKAETIETIVQEIIREENVETIVQEVVDRLETETLVQEVLKPENTVIIVEQVMKQIIDRIQQDVKDGVTFVPKVDAWGNLSWTNDGGLENPAVVNIMGRDGEDGKDGADGHTPVKGEDYFTEEDKAEIINAVVAAFGDADEVSY